VNFSLQYPIKVPEVIRSPECVVEWSDPDQIEHDGLYKVRVVPPKGLFLPVLPMRVNKQDPRLLFMLCAKCAYVHSSSKKHPVVNGVIKCHHNEADRAWTSTMTSIELRAALAEGYKITRCYRIWKYNEFDNLFKEYVQTFMKMKIESSGFPSNVQTTEEQNAWAKGGLFSVYINKINVKEYMERLGIEIDMKNVELNPGLRHISKLLLNSLWGKFGQRNNLTKSRVLKSPAEYFELILSQAVDIRQITGAGEEMMRVSYMEKESLIQENNTSNSVVALYTTRFFPLLYN
jgi:hypothetical protein